MTFTHRDYEVCRLCLHYIRDNSQVLIDTHTLRPENICLKNVIAICMPEVNLDRTIQRHICGKCLLRLRAIYTYKCKVSQTEEKVTKYFQVQKIPSKTKIDLISLVQEDEELEGLASSIDHTFKSLVSLVDGPKNESSEMCFYKNITYKCFMCDYITFAYDTLKDHYKMLHNKNIQITIEDLQPEPEVTSQSAKATTFRCDFPNCGFKVTNTYNFMSHKALHLRNFMCGKCSMRFSNSKSLERHINTHRGGNVSAKCTLCGHSTTDLGDARRHYFHTHKEVITQEMPPVIDDNSNECDIKTLCDDLSTMLDSFETENAVVREPSPPLLRPQQEEFKCKQCPYSGPTMATLVNHEISVHPKKRKISITPEKSQENASKIPHVESAKADRNKENEKEGLAIFQCKLCPYKAVKDVSLKAHVSSAHSKWREERKQKHFKPPAKPNVIVKPRTKKPSSDLANQVTEKPADEGSKNIKQNESKKKSPEVAPEEPPQKGNSKRAFGCFYCNKLFSRPENFKDHFTEDHASKAMYYKCAVCSFKTLFKHKLKQHHRVEHRYTCCWKPQKTDEPKKGKKKSAFPKLTKSGLKSIIQSESTERPGHGKYNCEYCDKSIDSIRTYVNHLMVHTRPFKCGECNQTAAEVRSIKNHAQAIHSAKNVTLCCGLCSYNDNGDTLAKHFNEVHKNTKEHLGKFFHHYMKYLNKKEKLNDEKNKVLTEKSSSEKEKTPVASNKVEEVSTPSSTKSKSDSDPLTLDPLEASTPNQVLSSNIPAALGVVLIKAETDTSDSAIEEPRKVQGVNEGQIDENGETPKTPEDVEIYCPEEGCEYKASSFDEMIAHKKDSHSVSFLCQTCGMKFSSLNQLNIHTEQHNKDTLMVKCCYCDFETSQKHELKEHYAIRHLLREENGRGNDGTDVDMSSDKEGQVIEINDDDPVELSSKEDTSFACKICLFSTTDKTQMNEHMEAHTNNPFICIKCDVSFSERSELVKHLVSHSHQEDVVDDNVDGDEPNEENLLTAVSFKCDRCSFRSNDDEKMKIHHLKCRQKMKDLERIEQKKLKIASIRAGVSPEDEENEKVQENENKSECSESVQNQNESLLMELDTDTDGNDEQNHDDNNSNEILLIPTKMEDPFESDTDEDIGKSLEEAIASINMPKPMVAVKKESDTAIAGQTEDENDQIIIDHQANQEPTEENLVNNDVFSDFVIIDDDDDI